EARMYINDNGEIEGYTEEYLKKLELDKKSEKKEKKSKVNKSGKKKDGCLSKCLKAPFKLLWWIIKNVLIIVSLGMLSDYLNSEK
ncbi:MAG: hypothetical protein IKS72_08090, partial [Prevotella sp.]|nr:hypothetical protein [Prevotella sp.]